jgi:hypothetical protein
MTLPPTVPFAKTFTTKHMSESLKLTRHCTSTRSSPMAMYLASKGSNLWEAAVKARPIVPSDDVTPVGWKIVDSSNQEESLLDDGKKKVGGIFSFFGRRNHNLSVDGNSKRTASPTTTSGVTSSKTSTPRAGSPATAELSNTSERSKPAVSEIFSGVDNTSPSTIPTKGEIQPEATQPSAVSLFLGRIVGRSKSQSNDSLALSANDLEFLADVPTSSDSNGLKSDDLTAILGTPPLPPPRPLAPSSRQGSPLPKLPPPPGRPTRSGGSDDLLSLFGPTPILNHPPSYATPSAKAATCQSTGNHVSLPNQLWTTFEEPAIKTPPSRHLRIDSVDLLESSSRTTNNGSPIKSDVFQVLKSSGSASTHVLAPPISPSSALPLNSVQDEDEFSEFFSSPPVQNSRFNSFSLDSLSSSSVSIPSIEMTGTHHDDFGEFGEASNDFQAPKPPPSNTRVPATVSMSSAQSETFHTRKASKKPDHSRTLSLLETAAARGRWLSPPSPIPEALSPPPDRYASSSVTVDPYGHKLDMYPQQALGTAGSDMALDTSTNTWRLPPPPSGTLLRPSVISSTPVHPRLTPPSRLEFVAQSGRSPSNAQPGGLSAQDLSFFEGL